MAATPLRRFRCSDSLWQAASTATDANGTTVSAVLVAALEQYVERHERQQPVRCEHPHDDGEPHPLTTRCEHPHFV